MYPWHRFKKEEEEVVPINQAKWKPNTFEHQYSEDEEIKPEVPIPVLPEGNIEEMADKEIKDEAIKEKKRKKLPNAIDNKKQKH